MLNRSSQKTQVWTFQLWSDFIQSPGPVYSSANNPPDECEAASRRFGLCSFNDRPLGGDKALLDHESPCPPVMDGSLWSEGGGWSLRGSLSISAPFTHSSASTINRTERQRK
ncbi:hypothetical protein INR49_008039 [Caranx melampygus]|nr:hypothetical protein INR49_008039 [Caranx melampygus]